MQFAAQALEFAYVAGDQRAPDAAMQARERPPGVPVRDAAAVDVAQSIEDHRLRPFEQAETAIPGVEASQSLHPRDEARRDATTHV